MTLPPVRELRFSAVAVSPESCWCRARRSTKSLVALGADGSSSLGGCSSPAFDLSPIGEGRERDDDSSPRSQDHTQGPPPPSKSHRTPPHELPTITTTPQRALWALQIHLCSLKDCWQINHNAAHQTLPTTIASINLVLSMCCFRTPSQHHQSVLGNIMQQVAGFSTELRLWYECACACLCACTPRPSLPYHVTWKA